MENNTTSPMPTLAQFVRFCGFAQCERGGNGCVQLTLIDQVREGVEKMSRLAQLSAEERGLHAQCLCLCLIGLSRDGDEPSAAFQHGKRAGGCLTTNRVEDQINVLYLVLSTSLGVVKNFICAKSLQKCDVACRGRRDHLRAFAMSKLNGKDADTA